MAAAALLFVLTASLLLAVTLGAAVLGWGEGTGGAGAGGGKGQSPLQPAYAVREDPQDSWSAGVDLAGGQKAQVHWDPLTGVPAFLTGPVTPPDAGDDYADVLAFFDQNRDLYRMQDPAGELEQAGSRTDTLGMTHLRLAQVYQGVPVFGAQLVVHFDGSGDITAINGDYYPGIDVAVTPEVGAGEAVDAARDGLGVDADPPQKELPQLVILPLAGGDARLAWKVVLAADQPPLRMVAFVNARDGGLISAYDDLESARSRLTYSANHGTTLPGTLMINEGGPLTGDSVVNAAHVNAGAVYDYYYNTFGRDSLDGSGMTLKSTVHYSTNYNNAFWNGSQMTYGDGDGYVFSPLGNALDVVAHELTHGITQFTAGLIYSYQSGALNESYSDVFGAMVDRDDWLMGEDVYTPQTPGDALRSLENPPLYGQPDHMNNYVDTSSDHGGVHTNSGIPNKAAYNVAAAIGKDKMEQVWYRTLTDYLTPGSQFSDARDASVQAAADLYGAGSPEVAAVDAGFAAVGIGGSGPPSETTARIEIDHTYRGDLVVTVGVGDPANPYWSKVVSNREGGSANDIYLTVDISGGADHLPPDWNNRWFLKVYDAAGYDTGNIVKFSVTDHGTTYTATNVPVPIYDYQTAYAYVPTEDDTPPSVTATRPAADAAGVYASTAVAVTFSEQMNPASIDASSFTLEDDGGAPVPADVSYDNGTHKATLQPQADLDYSTTYTATVTTDVTDLAGNHLPAEYRWSFTTAPPPRVYYFPWYDMQSRNMRDWLVMGNAGDTGTAGFDVTVGGVKMSTAPIEVDPGKTGAVTYPGVMGGPVKVESLNGEAEVVSRRTLYGDSFEEIGGIEESRLDSHYYFSWYDDQSPGASSWILIGNPGETAVAADIYIDGEKMNSEPYIIEAGGSVTPEFTDVMGGPVEVVAYEPGQPGAPRPVIASERTLWQGDFNEIMGIPAAELSSEYMSSWYDMRSEGTRSWLLVANPHQDRRLAVEIWIGGERMTDSASGEQYFTVEPGESITPQFPGVMNGPVVVKGYDAAGYDPANPGTPNLDFITSQRCLFGSSFEEVVGYDATRLAATEHFSWYDQQSSGARDWILVSNPGDREVKVEIWIGGERMTDSASGEQYFTVGPGESITPQFPGVMNGPVVVKGYDAAGYGTAAAGAPDAEIFTSQRVLWGAHFSEICGTVLD